MPEGAFNDVATMMTGRSSVCIDAETQLQVSSVLRDPNGAVWIIPMAIQVNEMVRSVKIAVLWYGGYRSRYVPVKVVASLRRKLQNVDETSHSGPDCRSSGPNVGTDVFFAFNVVLRVVVHAGLHSASKVFANCWLVHAVLYGQRNE